MLAVPFPAFGLRVEPEIFVWQVFRQPVGLSELSDCLFVFVADSLPKPHFVTANCEATGRLRQASALVVQSPPVRHRFTSGRVAWLFRTKATEIGKPFC